MLPHKTVATLAGLGFIGKCAALITEEFGSAVRIIVVLTNAPVECGVPVTKSLCKPECDICTNVCPGNAVKGGMWEAGIDRDTLLDPHACRRATRQYAKEQLGVEETLCALCIANCPWTKKALKYG